MPHPYLLVPLLACVANTALAVFFLTRDGQRPANRVAGALMVGASFWAACEVLWNVAPEAEGARRLMGVSALGWAGMGPLALEMLLGVSGSASAATRRARPFLALAAAGFAIPALATPWMHAGVVRQPWGWTYRTGPAFPLYYAFLMGCLIFGLVRAARGLRSAPSPAERQQTRAVLFAFTAPAALASLTGAVLPMLGIPFPHLGTLSFVIIGVTLAWSAHRYGHSLLAPRTFAGEILATLGDGVALLHLDGRIRSANEALARLLGRPRSELEGLPIGEFLEDLPLDPPGEVQERETELHGAGGTRPVALSCSPLRDKTGLVLGLVLVVRDLHEVVALRRRLVTSGRLAAVGELAGGIAHEINNPIAYVRTNLGVLRDELERLEGALDAPGEARVRLRDGAALIQESLEGVDRIAAIVRDLKGFAGGDQVSRELVDLGALLQTLLRVLAPHLRYRARIEVRTSHIPLVTGSPQELRQVFANLILNACQSLEGEGTILLVTERQGDAVEVRVEDDGRGIAPEDLERIFDPFFTTRPHSEGRGLGLAVAYQVVKQHGGEIAVEPRPGGGTVVRVRLPVAS